MIKSIVLTHIQSHSMTKMEFSSGVNVIHGETDSGKSAIIRSLHFVIKNKRYNNFITFNQERGNVLIEFDSQSVIKEIKKKKTLYSHTNDDRVIKEYKTGLNTIEEEIPILAEFKDYCFQKQSDPFFILSLTSGNVARYLNQITGLGIIDKAGAKSKKLLNDTKGKITYILEEIEELQEDIDYLQPVLDILKISADKLVRCNNTIIKTEKKIVTLKNIINHINDYDAKIKEASMYAKYRTTMDKAFLVADKRTKINIKLNQLSDIIDRISRCDVKLKIAPKIKALSSHLNEYKGVLNEVTTLTKKTDKLAGVLESIAIAEKTLTRQYKVANILQNKLKKTFPEICPLCGRGSNE